MLTSGEQQELHQIEEGLRDVAPGFCWRLTVLQALLRWAGPGSRAYLPALAALAAALLRLAAAAGRLLAAFAGGAMLMEPATLMVLGDTGWPGPDSWHKPGGHRPSPAPERPQPDDRRSLP